SYVLLLVGGFPPDPDYGDPGYTPTYSYTWSDAVADGAGSNAYDPGVPDTTICKVPSVVGKTLASAKKLIAASHCAVGRVVHKRAAHAKRSVIAQTPVAGKKLRVGSKIRLTVSRGSRR